MKEEHEQNKRSWFNIGNIFTAVLLLLLLVVLIWNQNITEKILFKQENAVALATITPTPVSSGQVIPSEFYSEPSETSGIIMGGVILLVIILGSSFWKLRTIKK